jgi:hypothetical protein
MTSPEKERRFAFAVLALATVLALNPHLSRANVPKPVPPQFNVEQLAWMSGDWQTAPGRMRIEEHWTGVAGGTLIGMSRTVVGDRTVAFEYLRIETRKEGIFYVAHPNARPGTDFKLVRVEGQSATFENPAHDFPKRIIYKKNAEGTIVARIEGDGTEKEKPQEFVLKPMK